MKIYFCFNEGVNGNVTTVPGPNCIAESQLHRYCCTMLPQSSFIWEPPEPTLTQYIEDLNREGFRPKKILIKLIKYCLNNGISKPERELKWLIEDTLGITVNW